MSRSNAESSGAEFHFNASLRNYFQSQINSTKIRLKSLADILSITFIFRINGHRCIAQLCFWTSSGNSKWKTFIVFKRVHFRVNFFINKFIVSQCGTATRTPIDHAVAAINQTVVIHHFENFAHRLAPRFIESIRLAAPIQT